MIDGHIDFDQLEFCAVWATRISFLPVSLQITRKFVISIYATQCIQSMGQLTPEAQVQTTVLQYYGAFSVSKISLSVQVTLCQLNISLFNFNITLWRLIMSLFYLNMTL